MNRILTLIAVVAVCLNAASAQQAQTQTNNSASSQTSASANSKNLDLQSGTNISGELQKTLDVRKAKVGDQVVLKTTKAIKSDGRKIVNKGATLIGHVTDVAGKTDSNNSSSISILFDTVQDGSLTYPLTATIRSLTGRRTNSPSDNETMFSSESNARSSSNASMAPVGGGGLVGGVTGAVGSTVNSSTATVGSVVGATTGAAGSVVNTTGNVVGGATNGVTGSLGRIQISESANASADGSSVLSLNGENLRLEKGTTFNLVVGQSANASTDKQP
jgi:hypothetical protein